MRQPAGSERDALEQIARAGRERADRVARAKILLAVADGARFTEAARIAGRRSGDAVARLVARWNAEGLASLEARYHGGRRGATGGVAARAVAEASEPAPTAIAAVTLPPASSVIPDAGGGGGDFITETLTNGHPSRGRLFVRGADIRRMLELALEIDGVLAVALVDLASGMILGAVERAGGSGLDLDVAAAGNTEVVRAKLATIRDLGMNGGIEDILITLSTQYHLIRPLGSDPGVFLYTVINREESRLALARRGPGCCSASTLRAAFMQLVNDRSRGHASELILRPRRVKSGVTLASDLRRDRRVAFSLWMSCQNSSPDGAPKRSRR